MSNSEFKRCDFEHPSALFLLEDVLKGLIGGSLLYRSYFSAFGLKGNENVLDFGCGGGVGSKYLATLLCKGGHLMCVDTSSYWMARAQKRLRQLANVECKIGDIRELNIPDSSFDIITIFHVIHEISPTIRQDVLKILTRKLKENGKTFMRERIEKSHGMPVSEIRSLFSVAGLKEIQCKVTKSEYVGKYQKAG